MGTTENIKFKLASGSKVREEDFGLLFYSMHGPRLFFINCGKVISPEFFMGEHSLKQWIEKHEKNTFSSTESLTNCLLSLAEKGVIEVV